MSIEERAERYRKNNQLLSYYDHNIEQAYIAGYNDCEAEHKDDMDLATIAFLQGADRARVKWHKPSEMLPIDNKEVLCLLWGSYYIGNYEKSIDGIKRWHFDAFTEDTEEVTAWCEIPRYEGE